MFKYPFFQVPIFLTKYPFSDLEKWQKTKIVKYPFLYLEKKSKKSQIFKYPFFAPKKKVKKKISKKYPFLTWKKKSKKSQKNFQGIRHFIQNELKKPKNRLTAKKKKV